MQLAELEALRVREAALRAEEAQHARLREETLQAALDEARRIEAEKAAQSAERKRKRIEKRSALLAALEEDKAIVAAQSKKLEEEEAAALEANNKAKEAAQNMQRRKEKLIRLIAEQKVKLSKMHLSKDNNSRYASSSVNTLALPVEMAEMGSKRDRLSDESG